jgi:type II secretory pathway predicted ATPase ExeA
MIRAFFGLDELPFAPRRIRLLPHQQEIHDTLRVHNQQGGLCLLLGVPGTGKSVIKEHLHQEADKRQLVASVARTLHTYPNTVKILCDAFHIEFDGSPFKCERRLIEEAYNLNRSGRALITIIDDAHLMEMATLRKLRLLFEDFPKNHNLVLIGQPPLLASLALSVNQDIKSRVTYSVITKRLNPDDIRTFITSELDRLKLGHHTFSETALELIVRSADGLLRRTRNLCLACMLEAVRAANKSIDLEIVNRVLIQPHWRQDADLAQF